MDATVVVTVLNEEHTIGSLIDSLLCQTKLPDEILIVDGGSKDRTVSIIENYRKLYPKVKLFKTKSTRASARNYAIERSKNSIIATTDAGCVAEKHWLERITEPFKKAEVGVVAGFYEMVGDTPYRKALSVFLGVTPSKFRDNFLASARSLSFRKEIWLKVGGFPENLRDAGEDTLFNYRILKTGTKIIRVKNAIVFWQLPYFFEDVVYRIYRYAKGDAQTGIWWHPLKGIYTHNVKIMFIYIRYLFALTIIWLSFRIRDFIFIFVLGFVLYVFWAFKKVFLETNDWKAGIYGILLQLISDFAVMAGFFMGSIGL